MGCTPFNLNGSTGFICEDVGGYMSKEEKWWRENLEEYKDTFIECFAEKGYSKEIALDQYDIILDSLGPEGLSTPHEDADRCIHYMNGGV